MRPIVQAMAAEGRHYQGVLYAGLMLVNRQPYVLEFNVRFGDPEAQILMARLDSDLLPLLQATTNGSLARQHCRWREEAAVCVVMAAQGYPEAYERGLPLNGCDASGSYPRGHRLSCGYDASRWASGDQRWSCTRRHRSGADIRGAIDRATKRCIVSRGMAHIIAPTSVEKRYRSHNLF